MIKALGIDYGQKHIGIAVNTAILVEPLMFLDNDQTAIDQILQLCQQHKIELIIIGISKGSIAALIKDFSHQLKQKTSLPIIFHDETLTSREASLKLRHTKRSFRAKPQDAFQAAIMLQDYLDSHQQQV